MEPNLLITCQNLQNHARICIKFNEKNHMPLRSFRVHLNFHLSTTVAENSTLGHRLFEHYFSYITAASALIHAFIQFILSH